jgi:hypothetical protein
MIQSFIKIMYNPERYKEITEREYREEEQRIQREKEEPQKDE